MTLKKPLQSGLGCPQHELAAIVGDDRQPRLGWWWEATIHWLDARSPRARLGLVVLASVMLWSVIVLGVVSGLRGIA